jgi:hypothetical protein
MLLRKEKSVLSTPLIDNLYRRSRSRQAEQSILKGPLLLIAWGAPLSRSTTDIDLLGRTSNEVEHVRGSDSRSHALFAQLCSLGAR